MTLPQLLLLVLLLQIMTFFKVYVDLLMLFSICFLIVFSSLLSSDLYNGSCG